MDDKIFDQLRTIVERESGIHLSRDKKQLLANRLLKRLRALGLKSAQEYLEIIELDVNGDELVNLINVVSTNVTYFYREPEHFHYFEELMARYHKEGRKRIRVWCAASSSGEEPYTLAMIALKFFDGKDMDLKVLASDISVPILKRAMAGIYDAKQLDKLPKEYLARHFVEWDEGQFQVSELLKRTVIFRRINLSKLPLKLQGPVDVIFCRNVMIYFEIPLRAKLIGEFTRILSPGGHLFLSHSENLLGIDHDLSAVKVAVYKKPSSMEGRR